MPMPNPHRLHQAAFGDARHRQSCDLTGLWMPELSGGPILAPTDRACRNLSGPMAACQVPDDDTTRRKRQGRVRVGRFWLTR